eukprot:TRINITY_DN7257_c1_g1_i1.p1 TRINITY_DN7257_c1_g1~~TRINITY_DN7257_c1_g1_i1.p1  ORF type:complete len:207 (+),score=33.00 TRINITY_DN7257_c1_g1_i1:650-1270(+)
MALQLLTNGVLLGREGIEVTEMKTRRMLGTNVRELKKMLVIEESWVARREEEELEREARRLLVDSQRTHHRELSRWEYNEATREMLLAGLQYAETINRELTVSEEMLLFTHTSYKIADNFRNVRSSLTTSFIIDQHSARASLEAAEADSRAYLQDVISQHMVVIISHAEELHWLAKTEQATRHRITADRGTEYLGLLKVLRVDNWW